MEDAHFGTTGTRVSKRCFGAWRFGYESDDGVETERDDALDVSLSDGAFDRIDDTASN